MKKILLSIAIGLIALLSVFTSFAADAKHSSAGKGSIVVDGNKRSAFDQKGKWVYTIQRFNSDNLPKNAFDVVRNEYYHYYITGMEKIEQPGTPTIFIAHLEDRASIKTVRVNVRTGETELVQDFVRG